MCGNGITKYFTASFLFLLRMQKCVIGKQLWRHVVPNIPVTSNWQDCSESDSSESVRYQESFDDQEA